MCKVVCVKICQEFPGANAPDERSFATRLHKPLAFAMESNHADRVPCSCWYLFDSSSPVVQDFFSAS